MLSVSRGAMNILFPGFYDLIAEAYGTPYMEQI